MFNAAAEKGQAANKHKLVSDHEQVWPRRMHGFTNAHEVLIGCDSCVVAAAGLLVVANRRADGAISDTARSTDLEQDGNFVETN